MEYRDDKYYLEIAVVNPEKEGLAVSCSIPFKRWNDIYKNDWRRDPCQDRFIENANYETYGDPSEGVCLYFFGIFFIIRCYLLARSKRWWNKVIKNVDANGVYHIKCKLPSRRSRDYLKDCEVTIDISSYVLPEDTNLQKD